MNADEPIPAHENWPCFVGSGECLLPAVFKIDDGSGGDCYICAEHKREFDEMEKRLKEGGPTRFAALAAAIKAVE